MHADHAGIALTFSIKGSLTHQSITYRCIDQFCEFCHLGTCLGNDGSAAQIDVWFFRLVDHLRYQHQFFPGVTGHSLLRLNRHGSIFTGSCRHILRNIDQDRAGSSASGDMECLADGISQDLHIFHNIAMLRNGHGHAGDIHLLEAVLTE